MNSMPTNEETSKESLGSSGTKKVEVVPYDTAWQPRFEELRLYLLGILKAQDVRVEHVGSTSVPGLAAKPILDIDLVLENWADFELVKARLEQNGYNHVGDLGIAGREAFKYGDKPQFMPHHLYVLSEGSDELKRHLTFRDWLRAHPEDRDLYARAKLLAAQQFPEDIGAYIDAKSGIIFEIYQRCGLYLLQSLLELAGSVIINRYNLRLMEMACRSVQPGVSLCEARTQEGKFYLLAWDKISTPAGEIAINEDALAAGLTPTLPTASGQVLCGTPFATFALFESESDALAFMDSRFWINQSNV